MINNFKGENIELSLLGLSRTNVKQNISSYYSTEYTADNLLDGNLQDFYQTLKFKPNYELNSQFSIFLEPNQGLDLGRLENPDFLNLWCDSMAVHIVSHLYSTFNAGPIMLDFLMIESLIGFEQANVVLEKVLSILASDLDNWLSKSRIVRLWQESSNTFIMGVEKSFYLTVNSYQITICNLYYSLNALSGIFNNSKLTEIILIVESKLDLNSQSLGFLDVIETSIQNTIKQNISGGFAIRDVKSIMEFMTCEFNRNRYKQACCTNYLSDYVTDNVIGGSNLLVTSVDYIIAILLITLQDKVKLSYAIINKNLDWIQDFGDNSCINFIIVQNNYLAIKTPEHYILVYPDRATIEPKKYSENIYSKDIPMDEVIKILQSYVGNNFQY